MPMKTTQKVAMPTHHGDLESSGDSPNGSDFGFDEEDDDKYYINTLYDDEDDEDDDEDASGSGDGGQSPGSLSSVSNVALNS